MCVRHPHSQSNINEHLLKIWDTDRMIEFEKDP